MPTTTTTPDTTVEPLGRHITKKLQYLYNHFAIFIRILQQINIGDTQFGFMKGKETTDTIFIV